MTAQFGMICPQIKKKRKKNNEYPIYKHLFLCNLHISGNRIISNIVYQDHGQSVRNYFPLHVTEVTK